MANTSPLDEGVHRPLSKEEESALHLLKMDLDSADIPTRQGSISYEKIRIMQRIAILSTCLLLAATALPAQTDKNAPDRFFSRNLVVNPGAEAPPVNKGIPSWSPWKTLADWSYMRDTFGSHSTEWAAGCDQKCGLPRQPGKAYFRLPVDKKEPAQALSQKIDLSGLTSAIDTGKVLLYCAAQAAGVTCTTTGCAYGSLSLVFYDKDGKELHKLEQKRDNAEFKHAVPDDNRMMLFEPLFLNGELPSGTASAVVTLSARSTDCCQNASVFFDNVQFYLMKPVAKPKQ